MDPSPELEATGAERVELLLSPSPGQKASPLAKTASGGELSRTMLACRSVMADLDDVPTLVFDEVDAGIGGEAGLAVGRRLARFAETRQVLVVTHLPQIACFADRHILVEKTSGTATVRVLSDDERVRELSRMLAGLDGERRRRHPCRGAPRDGIGLAGRRGGIAVPGGLRHPRMRGLPSMVTRCEGGESAILRRPARAGSPRTGPLGATIGKESHTSTSKTRGSRRWSSRRGREAGIARVDRRTKDLVPRAAARGHRGDRSRGPRPRCGRRVGRRRSGGGGERLRLDQRSLSQPRAVSSLIEAGIPLIDRVGPLLMTKVREGDVLRLSRATGSSWASGSWRSACARATAPCSRDMEGAQDGTRATVRELRAEHPRVPPARNATCSSAAPGLPELRARARRPARPRRGSWIQLP